MTQVDNQLCLAMLGRTGNGKSSSANTIMRRDEKEKKDFVAKSRTTSVTKNVRYGRKKIGAEALCVFDTPGDAFEAGDDKEDVGKSDDEKKFNDLERTITCIKAVLRECDSDGDVSAFVLVLRYGERFTGEEKTTVSTYKKILGQDVFSEHGIMALSYGDSFEQQEGHSDVKRWCNEQVGPFRDLYNECKQRVVLMYNTTNDSYEEKRQKGVDTIIYYARQIKSKHGSYTWEKFKLASESRQAIYLEYQSLVLTTGLKNKLEKINNQMAALQKNLTEKGRKDLLIQIGILRGLIEEKREGRPLYNEILYSLNILKQNVPIEPVPKPQNCPHQHQNTQKSNCLIL